MAEIRSFSPGAMQKFIVQVYRALGADQDVAAEVALHLVRSSLSGHDSHGVIRVAHYVGQIDRGELIPSARPAVAHETEIIALIDAHRGFGHFATAFTLECALKKARQHGLAAAAIRHCNHIGRLGEYTERAAEQGFVCILTVGVAGSGIGGLALYGSRRRFFGANPWSMAVPVHGRSRRTCRAWSQHNRWVWTSKQKRGPSGICYAGFYRIRRSEPYRNALRAGLTSPA